jgi:Leucine-rich repeat (LRR) protein
MGQEWMNLERIIIEKCGYCDVEISIPEQNNLTEIVLIQSNYMKIKNISCESSTLQSITFDNNKYLTFKGIFRLGINIKEIRFLDCPYCDLVFEGQLLGCERFHVVNCNHGNVKFDRINLPALVEFGMFNSSYFTLKKSSNVLPSLRSIQLMNSSYSSLPDPRMYPAIQEISVINSDYLGLPNSLPKNIIRQQTGMPMESNDVTRIQSQEIVSEITVKSPRSEANYCPYCGGKIQADFKFCPQCNSPLEFE